MPDEILLGWRITCVNYGVECAGEMSPYAGQGHDYHFVSYCKAKVIHEPQSCPLDCAKYGNKNEPAKSPQYRCPKIPGVECYSDKCTHAKDHTHRSGCTITCKRAAGPCELVIKGQE